MERYILRQFLSVVLLCLFGATSLFLVFETLERMRIFVRNDATVVQAVSYLLFKIPYVIQLMTPVSMLVATLITIGRLSQLSEITAMRACGASIALLARPLLITGLLVSVVAFFLGETIVPWSSRRMAEIYHIDIKKKDITGRLNKEKFWYRNRNDFYSIGLYDSRSETLRDISIFGVDESFKVHKRIDAQEAHWSQNPHVGWTLSNAIEIKFPVEGSFNLSHFGHLPLVIEATPQDFYNLKTAPETLSYLELKTFAKKLAKEGVPATRYLVYLASKISFPFVNLIAVLVAFPFALVPARSGNLSLSFVAGTTIGFGYYIVHAVATSFGAAELIPVIPAAWTANILLGVIGGYLLAGAEFR